MTSHWIWWQWFIRWICHKSNYALGSSWLLLVDAYAKIRWGIRDTPASVQPWTKAISWECQKCCAYGSVLHVIYQPILMVCDERMRRMINPRLSFSNFFSFVPISRPLYDFQRNRFVLGYRRKIRSCVASNGLKVNSPSVLELISIFSRRFSVGQSTFSY